MALRLFLLSLLFALLAACGKPVPDDKLDYVGYWQGEAMALLISRDGSVVYKRVREGMTTSVNGPLKTFHDGGFDVGVGPMATTFEVSEPPRLHDGQWQMVVDGVTLTRADGQQTDWL